GAGKNYRVIRRTYNVERITGDLKKLQGRGDRGLFGERPKGWRLSVPPAIGHDTERLDEALPSARKRDGHGEIDDLVCGEVRAQLLVERRIDDRVLAGEPVRQTERGLRAVGQVGLLVVGELRDQVFRRASAHRRGRTREASVHALVVPGELDPYELEQLGLDARAAAVDVANEAPRGFEEAGPARHRQEKVVVLVGVPVPLPEHAPELRVQLLASRLRKETAFVGHRILQGFSAAGKETRRRA